MSEQGDMQSDLQAALQRWFGFGTFRPRQDDLVQAILDGRDAVGVMPTGGGKSLCYQLPALLSEGVAVVISPLIALMKDQVDALRARGIAAGMVNSAQAAAEQSATLAQLLNGELKLLYIAPERLRYSGFLRQLERVNVAFYAIDEAHCVSQWGHDFRPDYLGIGEAIEKVGRRPIAAFTATATPEVREDILRFLKLRDPMVLVTGFARPNLSFSVRRVDRQSEKLHRLLELAQSGEATIVYCATRKQVEKLSESLTAERVAHAVYHGGFDDRRRDAEQEAFMQKRVNLIIATNAFGMGIDRADIRTVLHYEMPGSVEAYYQEAGRAGRDGMPARCELLFNFADKRIQEFFIEGANPPVTFVEFVYEQLQRHANPEHCVEKSIQDLAELLGTRNGMQVGSALKVLAACGAIERYDIPGERIRGTRLCKPTQPFSSFTIDREGLAEKERRDWLRLDRVIHYAEAQGCRQNWIQAFFGETDTVPCGSCDNCNKSVAERGAPLDEAQRTVLLKILSGVARMSDRRGGAWEGRFGKGLIVQMLVGSTSKRIEQFGLQRLSTYGLLRREGSEFVSEIIEECRRRGYLVNTGGRLPLLTLTRMGDAVMRGRQVPVLRWPQLEPPLQRRRPPLALESERPEAGAADADLLQSLKQKRLQLAKIRGNVPPYRILSNAVLEAMATHKPLTREESLQIPGIGETKARTVVGPFLEVIARHINQR